MCGYTQSKRDNYPYIQVTGAATVHRATKKANMDVDFVVQKGGNTSIATIRNDLSNNGIASDSDGAFRANIGNNGNLFGTDEACTGAF